MNKRRANDREGRGDGRDIIFHYSKESAHWLEVEVRGMTGYHFNDGTTQTPNIRLLTHSFQ